MRKTILAASLAATAMLSAPAFAYDFGKPVETPVNITSGGKTLAANATTQVTIMKIKLSKKEKQALEYRKPLKRKYSRSTGHRLPPAIQLGMNDVPVLNQGRHGSCVTFATTAALEAVFGEGDFISQLCSLELGKHFERNGYYPSGWNGSLGPLVLNQLMQFGVVTKKAQIENSCADVTEYPTADAQNTGNEMGLAEYSTHSMNINQDVYWKHLFSNDQAFDWKTDAPQKMQEVLDNVKEGLKNGNRSTFGVFLILGDHSCRAGACATHNQAMDTWALTEGLETPPYEIGGHEMVITGYDDDAVAYDAHGGMHRGLLTLRNSWGENVGDNGNFYMSYDYFIKYASEVQEIVPVK